MTLPAPDIISVNTKLNWTAAQQAWPIWIYLAQKVLEAVVARFNPMVSMRTERQKRDETARYIRRAYLFALGTSAFAHLLYTGLGLAAWLAPGLLSSKLAVQLRPESYFVPVNPFNGFVKAASLPDGALWFLQWDLIVGVLSTMVWGVAVRLSAMGKVGNFGAWARALFKYGLIGAVVGPSGAAVVAIWGRDEIVLAGKEKK